MIAAEATLIIRDRQREVELLARCLRLEQSIGRLRAVCALQHKRMTELGAVGVNRRQRAEIDAAIVQLREHGMTWQAIGARLGMAATTARSRYLRAKGGI